MSISSNSKLKAIQLYLKRKGWTDEVVILNEIICDIEENKKIEVAAELNTLLENYDTISCREFFYRFKNTVTNKKGQVDLLRLENTWQGVDSAITNLS